jgi:hypothetical protein
MHFSINLLRIKGLYTFRALLAHPQEALNKRHLVYCMRIMSVGCGTVAINWMKSASRWFHHTDILWCTVSYTDILWCTVTILIYDDARSLYWYNMMHGQLYVKLVCLCTAINTNLKHDRLDLIRMYLFKFAVRELSIYFHTLTLAK